MPSLRTLARSFAPMAQAFVEQLRRDYPGAGFTVTSAKRSRREQLRLYQAFLRGDNDGLPASPPGFSDHEMGYAFDLARLNADPLTDPLLAEAGRRWEALGGVWGGRWQARDPVHFSAPGSLRHVGPRRRRTSTSTRHR